MGLAGNQRSRGAGADKRYSIITRFLTTSFSVAELQWYHEEGWEESLLNQLIEQDLPMPLGIYRFPPWVKERYLEKLAPDRPVGRWILRLANQPSSNGIGYAEAFVQLKGFNQAKLFVSRWGSEGCSQDLWNQALNLLISGILIGTKCDLLRVYPLARTQQESVPEGWSEFSEGAVAKSVVTPVSTWSYLAAVIAGRKSQSSGRFDIDNPFAHISELEVTPVEWWASPSGKAASQTLHYLKARIVSDEDRKRLSKPRSYKRRLARFLSWS